MEQRNYAAEEKRIKRQQALATMLSQSSTGYDPSQTAGGYVIPISPMQGLAEVGQKLASALMMRSADKKETSLATDKAKATGEWLARMPKDGAGMADWAAQGNTLSPEISGKVVGSMVDSALKPEEFGREVQWAVGPDGKPVGFVLGTKGTRKPIDGVAPRDKLEVNEATGQAYNPYELDTTTRLATDPNKPFTVGADGRPVANQAFQSYEVGKAAAGATRVNTNILPNTVQAEVGKAAIGDLSARRGMAQTAAGAVGTANRIMEAIDSGQVMTGPGTGAVLALSKYFRVPGTDAAKIAATQGLVADLAAQTLAAKDKLGGGVLSDNDIAFLKQVSGGDPNLDGRAIRRIAELSAKAGVAMIDTFNRDVSSTQSYLGQPLPYDYQVQAPNAYKRPPMPGPEAGNANEMRARIAAERARRAAARGRQ